jgi:ABC-type transport system substrate-binding protein
MNELSRRDFVKIGAGALTATSVLAGCTLLSTEPSEKKSQGGGRTKGKEAPSLAQLVKDGKLPPVRERVPAKPLVIEPVERVGVYGGTWHTAVLGPEDTAWLLRTMTGQDRIVRWDLDWEKVLPNAVESFDFSDEGTEYTFRLRPGMKWSDGEPFTADDIVFWYEDVFLNEELTPVPAEYLTADGKPVTVTKVDEDTVRFTFAAANGLFLQWLATYDEAFRLIPRHYLEQFHTGYAADLEALVKREGMSSWVDLFFARADLWANPDLPRLHAWIPTNALGDGTQLTFERNPYYYKVDPDGSQLPYLDSVVLDVVSVEQTLVLKARTASSTCTRATSTPRRTSRSWPGTGRAGATSSPS